MSLGKGWVIAALASQSIENYAGGGTHSEQYFRELQFMAEAFLQREL